LKTSKTVNGDFQLKVGNLPPKCNHKLDRILLADASSDKIIIIADGDGDSKGVSEDLSGHAPRSIKAKVEIIVYESEIEEWICKSLRLNFQGIKPSERLKQHSRGKGSAKTPYHHRDLPSYAKEIDIPLLLRTDMNFQRLVSCLS